MRTVALIAACGRGERFGFSDGIPKQYLPLAGIPILRHTILCFLNHPEIDDVMCIINREDIQLYEEAVAGLDLLNPVFGAETRQSSVRNGLEALLDYNPDKVLIHDAVRPFVSKKIISGIIAELKLHQAVIPAIAVEDTIKKSRDGKIEWTLERQNLWRAQTPQGFIYEKILSSHKAFNHMHFTDDAALDEYAGIPVAIVPGSQNNFKITSKEDYEMARHVVSLLNHKVKHETRFGIGSDIHKFREREEGENEFIRICGVDVKYSKKIKAHSDGDVGIHAAIDALLGASADGDIGEHFPDTDPRWRNCDSKQMLRYVSHILRKKGTKIINIDITIACEKPKISPFKKEMALAIARCLGISENRVNVKAKTNEGLDAVGRGEAIAAQAIASVEVDIFDEDPI